ncbi:MAG: tRNA (N6-isopentenyl adenosine(37)-C2)-methylthiotransferase MiaB [Spirochaetes bacterium]|nr:tRNA (N6-isopentenyl adenosine(37)-C2)-methylthiotransferase MiaB [Spirochaetota bacterium]
MPKRFFMETYGCQMNKADSASIRGLLIERGFTDAEDITKADVVIINTCVVREHAENRVYARLGYFRHIKERINPALKVVLTGCLTRFNRAKLEEEYEIDLIADVYSQAELADCIANDSYATQSLYRTTNYKFKPSELDPDNPIRAYVSITHGCDNWCSYCIVPAVRGTMISRPADDIIDEVKRLCDLGVKEITLLGQNVNSYGTDIGGMKFVDLLERIDKTTSGQWIRFMTSHPKDFSKTLADAVIDLQSLCGHVHLPLQSGSNRILSLMGRSYSREDYLEKIGYLRSRKPDFPLSTDIIVGFADETDAEYEETASMLRTIRFEDAYLYHYSERKGSRAAEKGLPCDEATGRERLAKIIALQRSLSADSLSQCIGTTMSVLIESKARDGGMIGRSRENRMVVVPEGKIGDIVTVTAKEIKGHTLIA